MKVLLDTCTFIWLTSQPQLLSRKAKKFLTEHRNEFCLSDVTALEIGLKYGKDKIRLPQPPRTWVEQQIELWNMNTVAIDRLVMWRSTELPFHHSDPFDRLLIATAIEHGFTIVTPDPAIKQYPVSTYW